MRSKHCDYSVVTCPYREGSALFCKHYAFNQWTGLLDWTTGLTFDHKNSFAVRSVGHEIDTKMSNWKSKDFYIIGSEASSCL